MSSSKDAHEVVLLSLVLRLGLESLKDPHEVVLLSNLGGLVFLSKLALIVISDHS